MVKSKVIFDGATQSFRCQACMDTPHEVTRFVMRDPERFTQMRERVEQEHAECSEYPSPKMALNARRMKKRLKRELEAQKRRLFVVGGMSMSAGMTF